MSQANWDGNLLDNCLKGNSHRLIIKLYEDTRVLQLSILTQIIEVFLLKENTWNPYSKASSPFKFPPLPLCVWMGQTNGLSRTINPRRIGLPLTTGRNRIFIFACVIMCSFSDLLSVTTLWLLLGDVYFFIIITDFRLSSSPCFDISYVINLKF